MDYRNLNKLFSGIKDFLV